MVNDGFKKENTIRRDTTPQPIERWHIIGERGLAVDKTVTLKDSPFVYKIVKISDKGMITVREEDSIPYGGKTVEPASVKIAEEKEDSDS